MEMVDTCCMWCAYANESRSACGIRCGINSFIHQDGSCPDYKIIQGADLAQNEAADYGDDLTLMANAVKWMLRENGDRWSLLGAAIIDRLQEIAEEAETWGGSE